MSATEPDLLDTCRTRPLLMLLEDAPGLGYRTSPGQEHPDPMADSPQPRSMAIPLVGFAAGAAVALLVGVLGTVHDPTLAGTTTFGFRTVIDMKVALSVAIGVLALLQLIGALWIYGKVGSRAPSWLGTAHRISGAIAVVLTLIVSYHCLWTLGLLTRSFADGGPVSTRTVGHGFLGCAAVGALVVKAVAVRSKRWPAACSSRSSSARCSHRPSGTSVPPADRTQEATAAGPGQGAGGRRANGGGRRPTIPARPPRAIPAVLPITAPAVQVRVVPPASLRREPALSGLRQSGG